MMKWITSKEISIIANNCGMDKAREILKEANEKVKLKGCIVINARKAPKPIVLELLGLTEEDIAEPFDVSQIMTHEYHA